MVDKSIASQYTYTYRRVTPSVHMHKKGTSYAVCVYISTVCIRKVREDKSYTKECMRYTNSKLSLIRAQLYTQKV